MKILYRFVEVGKVPLIGPGLVHEELEKVRIIRKTLKKTQSIKFLCRC